METSRRYYNYRIILHGDTFSVVVTQVTKTVGSWMLYGSNFTFYELTMKQLYVISIKPSGVSTNHNIDHSFEKLSTF